MEKLDILMLSSNPCLVCRYVMQRQGREKEGMWSAGKGSVGRSTADSNTPDRVGGFKEMAMYRWATLWQATFLHIMVNSY